MTDRRSPALVSIHDVMPATLDAVEELIGLCQDLTASAPALLVVPGLDWRPGDLERLHGWQAGGCELIAHGWVHETQPRRLGHRLHAAFLSRSVAEHLDLDAHGIIALMRRSHAWFADTGFPPPETYIPPAWALGMPVCRLSETPFRRVETLSGILFIGETVYRRSLPLVGFEADTALRAAFLRFWNARSRARAARHQTPLRISIHPGDHHLRLAGDLRSCLTRPWHCMRYSDLAG